MSTATISASTLKILTKLTSKPSIPLDALVDRIFALARILSEKQHFAYQEEFGKRVIAAVLLHDGDMITALWSRQAGKSQCIADTCAALAIILPALANTPMFEDDWRLNCTDEQGNYRGYKNGIRIGIYAPKQEQADIAFSRLKDTLSTDSSKQAAAELGVGLEISNANRVILSNGSKIRAQSASEQSNIEGDSYHVLILDEAQDIGTLKVRKSLHPMVSAYNGVIIKIGTCSVHKSDFYTSIKQNEREFAQGGQRNHFFYNYLICVQYNSMYRDFIEKEKMRLGEDSDEFRLSYCCEWLLERGQFITSAQLMRPDVALVAGGYHKIWDRSSRLTTQVAGIDLGKIHDPSVITVMDVDWVNPVHDEWIDTPEGQSHFVAYNKHIVGWMMLLGDNYEEQFAQIVSYLSRFKGLRKIVVDQTGVGQWGFDRFATYYGNFDRGMTLSGEHDHGLVEVEGLTFTPANKSDGFKIFHSDIMSGRLTFPAGEIVRKTKYFRRFVGEMLDLRKMYNHGYMVCEAPDEPGAHDDFPVSAMLASWGAQTPADSGIIDVMSNNDLIRPRRM